MVKYKCIANQNEDGGIFEIKFTEKNLILIGLEKPFFTYGCIDSEIWNKENKKCLIPRNNKSKNCLRDWKDGTFAVYFHRSGIPHYFELIQSPTSQTKSSNEDFPNGEHNMGLEVPTSSPPKSPSATSLNSNIKSNLNGGLPAWYN
jgi:hypothetical protein